MKNVLFKLLLIGILFSSYQLSYAQMKTEDFSFEFNGNKYSGLLDYPSDENPSAIIVMIHGHGETNVVEQNWYKKTRSHFVSKGVAVCVWDKAGCGKSEGAYEHNQSVQSSAKEAIAAIKELRKLNIVNSDSIGLWGISRAGWTCPLIIEEDKSIAFWISVSGTDNLDNIRYLLESNLRIEGRTEPEIGVLISEWDYCNKYQRGGKTYYEFIKETKNLFQDSLCIRLGMGLDSEEDFVRIQEYYQKKDFVYDSETGLQILVPGFHETLSNVNCPVLSISGEKDSQINWEATINLYKETMANLTIKTLPNCNHNMRKCDTGGLYEDLKKYNWQYCDGYYETMLIWLTENGFTNTNLL